MLKPEIALIRFFVQYSRTNIRKHSFGNRVVPLWNNLPNGVKNATNLNTFKNLLDDHKIFDDVFYEYDS